MPANKEQIAAVSAALKKVTNINYFSGVFAAVEGDSEVAHDALWSLIRAGKFGLAKHWAWIGPLEASAGPVAWADFITLLRSLPPELAAPGGAKGGFGFALLGSPIRTRPDVPRGLATVALRAAASDSVAAAAFDDADLPELHRLVIEYARAAAGLPLTDEVKARVRTGLARAVILEGLIAEVYLLDPTTGQPTLRAFYCNQETFLNNDGYVLAAQVGSRDEWERALAEALAEEANRKETDRWGFRGIPYLECAEPGLRLLSPEVLAIVLGIADGPMEHRPWAAIARDAIGRLSAEERARALASVEARNASNGSNFRDPETSELLRG